MRRFSFISFPLKEKRTWSDGSNYMDAELHTVGETCKHIPPLDENVPRRIEHVDTLNGIYAGCTNSYITTEQARYEILYNPKEGTEISRMNGDYKKEWIESGDGCNAKVGDFIKRTAAAESENMRTALLTTLTFFACPKEEDKPRSASKAYERLGGMRHE